MVIVIQKNPKNRNISMFFATIPFNCLENTQTVLEKLMQRHYFDVKNRGWGGGEGDQNMQDMQMSCILVNI